MKTKFTRISSILLAVMLLVAMLPVQALALDNGGEGGTEAGGELDWICVSGTHYFDEGVVTTAATCTAPGVTTYTCAECGTTRTDNTTPAALGHDWSNWSETTAATCTVQGQQTRTCSRCDAQETQTINALGHNMVAHAAVAATCTAAGNSAYWYCNRCEKYFSDAQGNTMIALNSWVIAATGHTVVNDAAVAPTCTTTGLTAGTHCSVCDAVLTAQEVVAALGHNMTAHAAVAATCTAAGNSAYWSCDRCNKYFSDAEGNTEIDANSWVLAATGHDLTAHAAVAATCTTAGNSAYWSCADCGKYFSDAEGETEIAANSWVIAATGHDLTAHAAVAATCTTAGNSAYWSCADCGKYFSDAEGNTEIVADSWVIAATGHTVVEDAAVAATCTTAGKTAGSHCSVCNAVIVAQETVAALGHDLVHHDAQAATCTEIGWAAYDTCSRCDYTTYEEIPAAGHTVVEDAAVAATCTTAGKTAGSHCSVCNAVIVAQETVPATGHTWVAYTDGDDIADFELKAEATTEAAAVYYKNCSVCGESAKGVDESATFSYGEPIAEEPEIVYGDVNGDGMVTSFDGVLLSQYFADLVTFDALAAGADVNGDGSVTSFDGVLLSQYFADIVTLDDLGPQG